MLAHYDPKLPLKLAADASPYGVGAVILHVLPDGSEQPVVFASRSLTKSEKNYTQVEKEALALIFGVKKFHLYLYGRKFVLTTDHKPLLTILGPKKGVPSLAAARLQRWALLLSAYSYEIEFRSTHEHGNADGLSRLPLESEMSVESPTTASVFNLAQIESLPLTHKAVCDATRKDPLLSKVHQYTLKGWPTEVPEALKPYSTRRQELTVEGDCLLWGMRVILPKKLQGAMLQELHAEHPGASRMKAVARGHVWWPGLDEELVKMSKSCAQCQAVKQAPAVAPLHPWIWPSRPWQRVHVDFAGPFLGKSFLIIVDAHSKWPEVFEMGDTTTAKTIAVLRHLFASYGLPEQLVSDNGPQFSSADFSQFMKANGIKHTKCAPYHPSSNGAAERFVRTFKQAMKAGRSDGRSVSHQLANFLLSYRSTPHATTNVPPATLFLGRSIRTRFDLLKPNVEQTVCAKQGAQKEHHDVHARSRNRCVGDQVMAKKFRSQPPWVPGTTVQQQGPLSFLVDVGDGRVWKRHVDHLFARGDGPSPEPQSPEPENSEVPSSDDCPYPANPPVPTSLETDSSTPTSTPSEETPTSSATSSTTGPRYPSRDRRPPTRLM